MKYFLLKLCITFFLVGCASVPLNTNDNPQDIIGTGIKFQCEAERTKIEKHKDCM